MQPWVVVVIIGIFCILFSWFQKDREPASPVAADIENAMDLVVASMEEENRKLLEAMNAMKREDALRSEAWEAKAVLLEKQVKELKEELDEQRLFSDGLSTSLQEVQRMGVRNDSVQATVESALPSELRETKAPARIYPANGIRARYPELFELKEAGRSMEDIARQVGLTTGEAALILQLAKQEEEHHG
ncbi:hypothetical protein [Gorillibacterium sp. CAU 1737]|uniref:hypothetical protein n=1 Tax=Gorillibacterium sp. CAU 1737 TaxID=3140362 RepID=UPI0032603BC0